MTFLITFRINKYFIFTREIFVTVKKSKLLHLFTVFLSTYKYLLFEFILRNVFCFSFFILFRFKYVFSFNNEPSNKNKNKN